MDGAQALITVKAVCWHQWGGSACEGPPTGKAWAERGGTGLSSRFCFRPGHSLPLAQAASPLPWELNQVFRL